MWLLLMSCRSAPSPIWHANENGFQAASSAISGDNVRAGGDVNGDGYDDVLVGDCSAGSVSVYNWGGDGCCDRRGLDRKPEQFLRLQPCGGRGR